VVNFVSTRKRPSREHGYGRVRHRWQRSPQRVILRHVPSTNSPTTCQIQDAGAAAPLGPGSVPRQTAVAMMSHHDHDNGRAKAMFRVPAATQDSEQNLRRMLPPVHQNFDIHGLCDVGKEVAGCTQSRPRQQRFSGHDRRAQRKRESRLSVSPKTHHAQSRDVVTVTITFELSKQILTRASRYPLDTEVTLWKSSMGCSGPQPAAHGTAPILSSNGAVNDKTARMAPGCQCIRAMGSSDFGITRCHRVHHGLMRTWRACHECKITARYRWLLRSFVQKARARSRWWSHPRCAAGQATDGGDYELASAGDTPMGRGLARDGRCHGASACSRSGLVRSMSDQASHERLPGSMDR